VIDDAVLFSGGKLSSAVADVRSVVVIRKAPRPFDKVSDFITSYC
jgi:hypothetical protein